jgi:carbonic anhydrase/acetyltransferase-like protein (isoleucine patch superfamily)
MEKGRMESTKIQEIKLFPYLDYYPDIHSSVFLASGVKIIGKVKIAENSSVWYNTVIRGDVHYIKIGSNSNIQDCSMLHVTNGKFPINIGNNVTVGHSVTLHGCTLQNLCLVGMGAVILDGAIIEEKAMIAAGAVITPGYIAPSGKLIGGVPGKIIRNLTDIELEEFEKSALRYKKYCEITIKSLMVHNFI